MMEELKPQAQGGVFFGVRQQIIFYNLICIIGLICIDFYIKICTTKDTSLPQGQTLRHLLESYISIEMAFIMESHGKCYLNEKYRGLPDGCLEGPSVSLPIRLK